MPYQSALLQVHYLKWPNQSAAHCPPMCITKMHHPKNPVNHLKCSTQVLPCAQPKCTTIKHPVKHPKCSTQVFPCAPPKCTTKKHPVNHPKCSTQVLPCAPPKSTQWTTQMPHNFSFGLASNLVLCLCLSKLKRVIHITTDLKIHIPWTLSKHWLQSNHFDPVC